MFFVVVLRDTCWKRKLRITILSSKYSPQIHMYTWTERSISHWWNEGNEIQTYTVLHFLLLFHCRIQILMYNEDLVVLTPIQTLSISKQNRSKTQNIFVRGFLSSVKNIWTYRQRGRQHKRKRWLKNFTSQQNIHGNCDSIFSDAHKIPKIAIIYLVVKKKTSTNNMTKR